MADLTTLADVKEWLQTGQQPFPPTDDRLLARLITAASVFIESWLARPIGMANWQEIRDGTGGELAWAMPLAVTPVQSILLLQIDGLIIPAAPALTTTTRFTAGYTFSPTELAVRGYRFCRGKQNVLIQYTAGYDDIPGDMEQACVELVVRKYRERTRIGERSRSLGGAETVTYDTVMFSRRDMKSDIQVLLQQYRQAAPLLAATQIPPFPQAIQFEDDTTPFELEDDTTPMVQEQ